MGKEISLTMDTYGVIFDLEGLIDAGDVDDVVGAMRPDCIEILKQAIADWELSYADKRRLQGSGSSGSSIPK